MTITLLQLRTHARQRANMENSQFVTDTELNDYINSSIAELQDLLISAYDNDYYVTSATFSTVSGTDTYALPDGTLYSAASPFYKLKGVDVQINGGDYFSVRPFNFNERNKNNSMSWGLIGGPNLRYRLMGSSLKFSPAPNGTYNVKVWYIPTSPKLAADSDTLDELNQFSEYVTVDAAMKCLIKEESDISALMAQKQAITARITAMAQNRDAGQPESISDIYAENNDYYFTRN